MTEQIEFKIFFYVAAKSASCVSRRLRIETCVLMIECALFLCFLLNNLIYIRLMVR